MCPITLWQREREKVAAVTDFFYLGSKNNADDGCSLEIRRGLSLGRKAMKNLDHVLQCKDISLPTVVHIVKVIIMPIVMHRCESWKTKKADYQRIDLVYITRKLKRLVFPFLFWEKPIQKR